MGKRLKIFILAFVICALSRTSGLGAEITHQILLRDGFVLRGVDGTLIGPDSNDVWFFELSSDVNDYKAVVKAGTRLELLPSSALERMTADVKMRSAAAYRLWNGRVTKYKGRNFIFPNYFLPLSKPKKPDSKLATRDQGEERPATEKELVIDEPNDVLTLPKEIIEKLKTKREKIVDSNRVQVDEPRLKTEKAELPDAKGYAQSADSIFVDRTALLVRRDDGRLVFVPDALGRNVQRLSLRLLPCEMLELTEREQSAEPETLRFKIAGIMTKYKGDNYLLLQKATIAYNHGNFGR